MKDMKATLTKPSKSKRFSLILSDKEQLFALNIFDAVYFVTNQT